MKEKTLTKEEQKEIAIHRLKQMNIYKPYIDNWRRGDSVTYFDHFIGYCAEKWNGEEASELKQYIDDHEKQFGDMVYTAVHNFTDFGELYTLLVVSKYAEDETNEDLLKGNFTMDTEDVDSYRAFAYVWNKTNPEFSEYGYVEVISDFGGIERVA